MLLVAPMSGHFATLLRGTVKTLLQDHDVYITDWHNPRDIPLDQGKFGLDEYTEHLINFLNQLGPRAHMVAICQPSVSALAAAATTYAIYQIAASIAPKDPTVRDCSAEDAGASRRKSAKKPRKSSSPQRAKPVSAWSAKSPTSSSTSAC